MLQRGDEADGTSCQEVSERWLENVAGDWAELEQSQRGDSSSQEDCVLAVAKERFAALLASKRNRTRNKRGLMDLRGGKIRDTSTTLADRLNQSMKTSLQEEETSISTDTSIENDDDPFNIADEERNRVVSDTAKTKKVENGSSQKVEIEDQGWNSKKKPMLARSLNPAAQIAKERYLAALNAENAGKDATPIEVLSKELVKSSSFQNKPSFQRSRSSSFMAVEKEYTCIVSTNSTRDKREAEEIAPFSTFSEEIATSQATTPRTKDKPRRGRKPQFVDPVRNSIWPKDYAQSRLECYRTVVCPWKLCTPGDMVECLVDYTVLRRFDKEKAYEVRKVLTGKVLTDVPQGVLSFGYCSIVREFRAPAATDASLVVTLCEGERVEFLSGPESGLVFLKNVAGDRVWAPAHVLPVATFQYCPPETLPQAGIYRLKKDVKRTDVSDV